MSSGATCSAGRAKKDWGRNWEGVVAMGVAWGWVEVIGRVLGYAGIDIANKSDSRAVYHSFSIAKRASLIPWQTNPKRRRHLRHPKQYGGMGQGRTQ